MEAAAALGVYFTDRLSFLNVVFSASPQGLSGKLSSVFSALPWPLQVGVGAWMPVCVCS